MTDSHKEALAVGREQGRIVRRYLEAIDAHRPKRGRKRTTDSISRRLDDIANRLEEADPLGRLQLVQERMNLEAELASKSEAVDLGALEEDFVAVAKEYSARKGITFAAWREAGVDASVLRRAGIQRRAS
ncbi:MAG: hypothetical protein ACRD03_12110 [Acidimicrobiales bacterium]